MNKTSPAGTGMILKTVYRFAVLLYALLMLISITAQPAECAGEQFVITENMEGNALAQLKDGEMVEFEFIPRNMSPLRDNPPTLWVNLGEDLNTNNSVVLKQIGGHWNTYYLVCCADFVTRKYAVSPDIRPDARNRLKIQRKKGWISVTINGTLVGGFPLRDDMTSIKIIAKNMDLDCRWITKVPKRMASSATVNVPAGNYTVTPPLCQIRSGERARINFTVFNINQDPEWASSIAIYIDKKLVWLNFEEDRIAPEMDDEDPTQLGFDRQFPINKDKNYVDIDRVGTKIKICLNGKFVGSFKHKPNTAAGEKGVIMLKLVGVNLKYQAKKMRIAGVPLVEDKMPAQKKPSAVEMGMREIDSGGPMLQAVTPVLQVLGDGESVKFTFIQTKNYETEESSADIGFDLGDERVFIRHGGDQTFVDPYNRGDESMMEIANLKPGPHTFEFRRKGTNVQAFFDGKKVKDYQHRSKPGIANPWAVKIKVFGSAVKYRVVKGRS